ncbi:type VI secretion system lipoprotein TssJ [Paraburkholderia bonniea]|nr:type VI secretion system lipoprotein TssJ [Paraburkholderia bonniea]WJF91475.1 type VI secretion system lipoprotein TssJ [Paraburkholderia bonniea]WJF94794.1 type VI secretion system lipoprotein TssJ [Paraburkholderia bonniea]
MTMLSGCGVGQAVKDSTVSATKWLFTTQVKTMKVDLASRAALNASDAGQSLSTVVRLYQLKTPDTFELLSYTQLQQHDLNLLKDDLLATHDVVLQPDAQASITEPMKPDAQYVGVVAFFRNTDDNAVWKLVVPKQQWKKTSPVRIEVRDNVLELRKMKKENG